LSLHTWGVQHNNRGKCLKIKEESASRRYNAYLNIWNTEPHLVTDLSTVAKPSGAPTPTTHTHLPKLSPASGSLPASSDCLPRRVGLARRVWMQRERESVWLQRRVLCWTGLSCWTGALSPAQDLGAFANKSVPEGLHVTVVCPRSHHALPACAHRHKVMPSPTLSPTDPVPRAY